MWWATISVQALVTVALNFCGARWYAASCRIPVVLGRGQRLFADGTPPATMRLVDTRSTGNGVVMHTYEAAGAPTFGTVQPEDVISES